MLRKAKAENLRVLICGGGDGLALREALRFPGVASADLVDYSAEVLEWGRTRFQDINEGAFDDKRAQVHIRDAWDYLAEAENYDAIFCDFTAPRRPEDTRVFTREWNARIHAALAPGGVAAFNGVSAQFALDAYGNIVQSLRAAGLKHLPYRVCIPPFGQWGTGRGGLFWRRIAPLRRRNCAGLECPVVTR